MSGRKINDYGGYASTSDAMMKSSNRVKHFQSAEGDGHLGSEYPDTTEAIHKDQNMGIGKSKSHAIKPGYRN